jgi:hypothetical protein
MFVTLEGSRLDRLPSKESYLNVHTSALKMEGVCSSETPVSAFRAQSLKKAGNSLISNQCCVLVISCRSELKIAVFWDVNAILFGACVQICAGSRPRTP